MSIIRDSASFSSIKKTIVTVGTFDGVHKGHQKIISQVVNRAKKKGLESILFTFDPHPRNVLLPVSPMALIQTIEERATLLESMGLNHVVIHPFTKAFSKLSAQEYVESFLVEMLNIEEIVIGHNHRFGRNRVADADELIQFGKLYDFKVTQINAEVLNDINISSTKIREALIGGNIRIANLYLGNSFYLTGNIIEGKKRGRTIGFPTANLNINNMDKIIPKNGVYVVQLNIENSPFLGMMNIGTNPTVNGNNKSIEIHIINWIGNLYGRSIKVNIIDRVRNEVKFDSIADLREQLEKDKHYILDKFNTLTL